MANVGLISLLFAVFFGSTATNAQEASANSEVVSDTGIQPRHLLKKICQRLGFCGQESGQGFGQGFGYQGFNGYGYNQGYPGQGPPINIGISQSQSSASGGGSSYGYENYPNNYQTNFGYPGQGYGQGYYGNRPGYYSNGLGSYNNQFNGNYYGGNGPSGFPGPYGWNGYQRPYGAFYDEAGGENSEGTNQDYSDRDSPSGEFDDK